MRHARKPRKWLKILLISVASVLVVALGAGVWFVASLASTFDSAQKIENPFPDDALRPPSVVRESPDEKLPQNILLLGSDTRGSLNDLDSAAGNRSDTMMLVNIPADRQSIQVVSFMRDFWVDIPGRGKAKMNAALAYGGIPLVVQTVESLVGVRIDHVAIIDFEGFRGVTDALGGVTVDNPIAFRSTARSSKVFPKGPVTLNGEDALYFVRERHAFVDGDYQRVRNQQQFIKAVLNKVLSAETLTNPVKVSGLVGAVAPFLAVDEGFSSSYLGPLALEASHLRGKDVRMFTVPSLGTGTERGQSIVRVNTTELSKIAKALQEDTLADYVRPEGN